jgi:hypothetical protein
LAGGDTTCNSRQLPAHTRRNLVSVTLHSIHCSKMMMICHVQLALVFKGAEKRNKIWLCHAIRWGPKWPNCGRWPWYVHVIHGITHFIMIRIFQTYTCNRNWESSIDVIIYLCITTCFCPYGPSSGETCCDTERYNNINKVLSVAIAGICL